jgi:hypothetical protein
MTKIERFDGAAAWAAMTEEERAAIGAFGIELAVAAHVAAVTEDRADQEAVHRAAQAAGNKLIDIFDRAVMTALPAGSLLDLPIPSLLGPVCRVCGCSEQDACGFGCSWADAAKTICTECAPVSMRRAS